MINSVTLVGRVGQDPEIKYFDSGAVKVTFSVASDRGFGENKVTDWFNIVAWGKLAEFTGEYVKKGTMLAINGQVECQVWQDAAGNARESFSVRANDIKFAGSKKDNLSSVA